MSCALNWLFSDFKFRLLLTWELDRLLRHSGESRNPSSPHSWTPAFAGVTEYLMPYVYLPVLSMRTGLVLVAHVGIGHVDCVPDR